DPLTRSFFASPIPHGRGYRWSTAAKKRLLDFKLVPITPQPPRPVSLALGTGRCHQVIPWPISIFTRKQHKLVIPDGSPNRKFVLLVGDSHLQSFAHGFAEVPAELSVGVMSSPKACAKLLRTEVLNADVLHAPGVVVLMAPSSSLTAIGVSREPILTVPFKTWTMPIFLSYLGGPSHHQFWVVVVDFPPRRNVEMDLQEFLRQEFWRVAASGGVF
ncbi:uncharacterized protein, partial [Clinocottus analis]|uniref:uncharacterized protein n=1 Tax=Clinocottus analis TaxID=304258 RepID=UPI0035C075FC